MVSCNGNIFLKKNNSNSSGSSSSASGSISFNFSFSSNVYAADTLCTASKSVGSKYFVDLVDLNSGNTLCSQDVKTDDSYDFAGFISEESLCSSVKYIEVNDLRDEPLHDGKKVVIDCSKDINSIDPSTTVLSELIEEEALNLASTERVSSLPGLFEKFSGDNIVKFFQELGRPIYSTSDLNNYLDSKQKIDSVKNSSLKNTLLTFFESHNEVTNEFMKINNDSADLINCFLDQTQRECSNRQGGTSGISDYDCTRADGTRGVFDYGSQECRLILPDFSEPLLNCVELPKIYDPNDLTPPGQDFYKICDCAAVTQDAGLVCVSDCSVYTLNSPERYLCENIEYDSFSDILLDSNRELSITDLDSILRNIVLSNSSSSGGGRK